MMAKTITRKKNAEIVKEELLNSLRERDTVEERKFNILNIIDQVEALDITNHYEDIIHMGNKKKQ